MNKNKFFTFLSLTSGAAASISMINKYIQIRAISKNLLENTDSLCYKWRLGNIHYTKTGNGKPLLLIHDLNSISSGYEWSSIIHVLSKHFTVYNIDLLGCGRSEKPNITYTNYLYVQLISNFIQSIIGKRADIITCGSSASVALMACSSNPELFDRLLLINPDSLLTCSNVPGKSAKCYKFILDLPILGTLIYHISTSKTMIQDLLMKEYFENPYSVKRSIVDAYYESAHLGESPKSAFSSIVCHYTKCNIVNALKKIDNSIYILGSKHIPGMDARLAEFQQYNPAIEITLLEKGLYAPQWEYPEEILRAIELYLSAQN